jgi:hypothetical protein
VTVNEPGSFAWAVSEGATVTRGRNTTTVIATMFVFISCISLPHFVIMHLFYRDES